jgi:hypothetical protein
MLLDVERSVFLARRRGSRVLHAGAALWTGERTGRGRLSEVVIRLTTWFDRGKDNNATGVEGETALAVAVAVTASPLRSGWNNMTSESCLARCPWARQDKTSKDK